MIFREGWRTSPRKPLPGQPFGPYGLITDPFGLMSGLEASWYEKVDGKPIRAEIGLQAGLTRYPGPWIDGLCRVLRLPERGEKRAKVSAAVGRLLAAEPLAQVVAALPEKARQALATALTSGGCMKYGQLARQVGDEGPDSYFWSEHPPTSAIGRLRLCGLLFVGRLGIGGRNWKVVVVPKELRSPLAQLLGVDATAARRAGGGTADAASRRASAKGPNRKKT